MESLTVFTALRERDGVTTQRDNIYINIYTHTQFNNMICKHQQRAGQLGRDTILGQAEHV